MDFTITTSEVQPEEKNVLRRGYVGVPSVTQRRIEEPPERFCVGTTGESISREVLLLTGFLKQFFRAPQREYFRWIFGCEEWFNPLTRLMSTFRGTITSVSVFTYSRGGILTILSLAQANSGVRTGLWTLFQRRYHNL